MTAKEKASQLYDMFYDKVGFIAPHTKAEQCALICVDEMINEIVDGYSYTDYRRKFWEEVKSELEKL